MDENGVLEEIYDVRVALRKSSDGEKTARVYVRHSKRGKTVKTDFPWPEGLDERDLDFKGHYHRKGGIEYYDSNGQKAPTIVAQKLEQLVVMNRYQLKRSETGKDLRRARRKKERLISKLNKK